MAYTWRAAAYHAGESNKDLHDPWTAEGYHFTWVIMENRFMMRIQYLQIAARMMDGGDENINKAPCVAQVLEILI